MDQAAHISKRFGDLEHLVDDGKRSRAEVLHEIRALKTEVLMALGCIPPEEGCVETSHTITFQCGIRDGR